MSTLAVHGDRAVQGLPEPALALGGSSRITQSTADQGGPSFDIDPVQIVPDGVAQVRFT